MMSTISGLVAGMLIAAFVTVMYGQQLSASLRHALNNHPDVKAVLRQSLSQARDTAAAVESAAANHSLAPASAAAAVEPAAASTARAPASAAGAVADALQVAADPLPQSRTETASHERAETALEQRKPQDLEQRWSEYAANADKLEPVGSFPWQRCFQRSAASYELPLALLLAIASGESNFDPAAHSDKNAVGLMQIRWPTTSRHLGVRRQADLYDPCTNVDAGARYLRELAQRYANNLHLVVAAYNYGPARVSATQVPEGAVWYSHYIFQHLQRVLGLEPTASSELVGAPARPDAGREVLMTFTRAHRARDFIAFLSARVPGLKLQQQSESLGRHDVVLLYGDPAEKRRAAQAMRAAGLEILVPPLTSSYEL